MIAAAGAVGRTEANVVEPLGEEGGLGILQNELRPVLASPNPDPLQWFKLVLCGQRSRLDKTNAQACQQPVSAESKQRGCLLILLGQFYALQRGLEAFRLWINRGIKNGDTGR
jgi:hypothetical protein